MKNNSQFNLYISAFLFIVVILYVLYKHQRNIAGLTIVSVLVIYALTGNLVFGFVGGSIICIGLMKYMKQESFASQSEEETLKEFFENYDEDEKEGFANEDEEEEKEAFQSEDEEEEKEAFQNEDEEEEEKEAFQNEDEEEEAFQNEEEDVEEGFANQKKKKKAKKVLPPNNGERAEPLVLGKKYKAPSEDDDKDFHLDAGTTFLNAYKTLKPDQVASMTKDTQDLMQTQKQLMSTLHTLKPLIKDGKEMMNMFQSYFGAGDPTTA